MSQLDLDALRELLHGARGMTIDFGRPLEPHQLRLMDTLGVNVLTEGGELRPSLAAPEEPRGDTSVPALAPLSVSPRTMIERVPEDAQLAKHLHRYADLGRQPGWSAVALRDRATRTVVLLACWEAP